MGCKNFLKNILLCKGFYLNYGKFFYVKKNFKSGLIIDRYYLQ